MLLSHSWLAPLSKPAIISEEDELDEDLERLDFNNAGAEDSGKVNGYDKEVADWVKEALEKKKSGKIGEAAKPALHTAPLDSVSPVVDLGAVAK